MNNLKTIILSFIFIISVFSFALPDYFNFNSNRLSILQNKKITEYLVVNDKKPMKNICDMKKNMYLRSRSKSRDALIKDLKELGGIFETIISKLEYFSFLNLELEYKFGPLFLELKDIKCDISDGVEVDGEIEINYCF